MDFVHLIALFPISLTQRVRTMGLKYHMVNILLLTCARPYAKHPTRMISFVPPNSPVLFSAHLHCIDEEIDA